MKHYSDRADQLEDRVRQVEKEVDLAHNATDQAIKDLASTSSTAADLVIEVDTLREKLDGRKRNPTTTSPLLTRMQGASLLRHPLPVSSLSRWSPSVNNLDTRKSSLCMQIKPPKTWSTRQPTFETFLSRLLVLKNPLSITSTAHTKPRASPRLSKLRFNRWRLALAVFQTQLQSKEADL